MKLSLVFSLALSMLTFSIVSQAAHHANNEHKKAVLVTGASSGIGAQITELLSNSGYHVYATARKDADLKRLNTMSNVEAIRLDVTEQDQIDAAVEFVKDQGRGLYGLVNNAGIVILGPLTEVPVDELEYQMDVNVSGPYRVTQAFAPLIIQSKGRITTTGSISGILAGKMFGLYSMSKHAVEAYTDALAAEMERFDVKVSVVEPGNYKSNIGATFAKRFAEGDYLKKDSAYAQDMQGLTANMQNVDQQQEPLAVAKAVLHALSDEQPKLRYMVTPNGRQAEYTVRQAMREALQLNHGQQYSLDRAALVKMLDELAAELEPQAAPQR